MFFNNIEIVDNPNKKWEVFHKTGCLTIPTNKIFNRSMRFMTIGSCFAEEIRKALSKQGVMCLPEYRKINIDLDNMAIDTLPAREHMNYYNSFSIRQEIERAAGLWAQQIDDHWKVKNRDISSGKMREGSEIVFQDPYRRMVFAKSESLLFDAIQQINEVMKDGFTNADVCVITLGMTEVFKKKNDGRVCNQVPVYGGGAGLRETEFYQSSFDDNLDNMRASLRLLKEMNPSVNVVLTVSPVPLHRTFNKNDIFVNNYESKCTLRAVVGQICREFPWVHYFPSFEIVWGIGATAYKPEDRLHVKENVVERIVGMFLQGFFVD